MAIPLATFPDFRSNPKNPFSPAERGAIANGAAFPSSYFAVFSTGLCTVDEQVPWAVFSLILGHLFWILAFMNRDTDSMVPVQQAIQPPL